MRRAALPPSIAPALVCMAVCLSIVPSLPPVYPSCIESLIESASKVLHVPPINSILRPTCSCSPCAIFYEVIGRLRGGQYLQRRTDPFLFFTDISRHACGPIDRGQPLHGMHCIPIPKTENGIKYYPMHEVSSYSTMALSSGVDDVLASAWVMYFLLAWMMCFLRRG